MIIELGINGIEAISSYHSDEDINFYLQFARENSLLVTAGSDFHGPTSKPKVSLGGIKGNQYQLLSDLKNFIRK